MCKGKELVTRFPLQADCFTLKMIALFCMTLDHFYVYFSPPLTLPISLRIIGRLAAPVFLFLTAWGCVYTRSRSRFMLRLYLCNVLMQIGSHMLVLFLPRLDGMQITNRIFSTLFYVVYYIHFTFLLFSAWKGKKWSNMAKALLALAVPLILDVVYVLLANRMDGAVRLFLTLFLPSPMQAEGGIAFVVLGVLFFYLRKCRAAWSMIYLLFSAMTGPIQNYMALALPLMWMYNGKRGRPGQKFFYFYYPMHIWFFYVLSVWMGA